MHENRETSSLTESSKSSRVEKGSGRTVQANGGEESDCAIVPEKSANKAREPQAQAAERMEGRAQIAENTQRTHRPPAQNGTGLSPGLKRVREAAKERKQERFTSLLHHLTPELLKDSYRGLKRRAAPGVDGMKWAEYEEGLEDRIRDLHDRVHRGTYRAQPSKRIYIPKADGRQRPIGIAALEDKIVQQAVVTILNQIYEVDFRGFSYGFRPGRDPHQALDALSVGIERKKVNWILDADIRGFFDNLSHEWLEKFLQHRIADTRMLRLIQKWLKAGVSEEGEWSETKVGTPQGAVVSPLLANVYLHYVFDLWADAWRNKIAEGEVIIVRYADDLVMGFQHRHEATRFLDQFRERLAKFGLELHPEKTRLIEFGRFAESNRREGGKGKPETFAFLGFTHICGSNSRGNFKVWRRTVKKRMRAKLQEIKLELRRRMHEPVPLVGKWLKGVVQGYNQYHAVPGNVPSLTHFRERIRRYWRHALRRRSQKARVTWDRMEKLFDRWLPTPKLMHPYPGERFNARHNLR